MLFVYWSLCPGGIGGSVLFFSFRVFCQLNDVLAKISFLFASEFMIQTIASIAICIVILAISAAIKRGA
jgi:hypothetical protein